MDFDRAFLELGLEVVVVDAELLPATEPLMALFVFDAGCSEKGDEFVEPLEATVCTLFAPPFDPVVSSVAPLPEEGCRPRFALAVLTGAEGEDVA
jgi:hypothetical protein